MRFNNLGSTLNRLLAAAGAAAVLAGASPAQADDTVRVLSVGKGTPAETQSVYVNPKGEQTVLTDANRAEIFESVRDGIVSYIQTESAKSRTRTLGEDSALQQALGQYNADKTKLVVEPVGEEGFSACVDADGSKTCDPAEKLLIDPADGDTLFTTVGHLGKNVILGKEAASIVEVTSRDRLVLAPGDSLDTALKGRYDRSGKFHVGASGLLIVDEAKAGPNFNGNLLGLKLNGAYQPFGSNWAFGAEGLFYLGNSDRTTSLVVPATTGPLADRLVMDGSFTHQYDVTGVGGGFTATRFLPLSGIVDLGLRGSAGVTYDWVRNTFEEEAVQKLDGNVLEGSALYNTFNHNENLLQGYGMLSLPVRIDSVCLVPGVGVRTNALPWVSSAEGDLMATLGADYCPRPKK